MSDSRETGRARARKLYVLPRLCEKCGLKPPTDRHHKDGNTCNNRRSNIEMLCRKCHMLSDGRLEALVNQPKDFLFKAPKKCSNCDRVEKNTRKGRCHRCNEFFRRNGKEWTEDGAIKKGRKIAPDRFCSVCFKEVPKGWSKGRCPTCRLFFAKHGRERFQR